MRRAVFMLMMSGSLALVMAFNAVAQSPKATAVPSQKKEANTAAQKAAATASKEKKEANPANSKTGGPAAGSVAGADSVRPDNQNTKPAEPPTVKILEITRLNDLNVQVTISLNEAARNNAAIVAGISGNLQVNAVFDNGQVASAFGSVGVNTTRLKLELRPFTPNQNGGNLTAPPVIVDEKLKGGSSTPSNGIKNEKGIGVPIARSLNATPRLMKATAKLSFSVKSGNQSLVLTDEQSRKF